LRSGMKVTGKETHPEDSNRTGMEAGGSEGSVEMDMPPTNAAATTCKGKASAA
jgi:hypothetical protein